MSSGVYHSLIIIVEQISLNIALDAEQKPIFTYALIVFLTLVR